MTHQGSSEEKGNCMAVQTKKTIRSQAPAANKAKQSRTHKQALVEITEVILRYANVEELIPRLIETVQRVMEVDNVAILRLDASGQTLVMYTVRGPEAAVADQVRVPRGQGVAGRIVASGEPLYIPDLSKAEVINSFLSQHLCSLLGVPLRVANRPLGVIHVSTVERRRFTKSDMHLLELVADRVALALDRISMVERAETAQALAEERAGQLEAIFASMTDGVFVMDAAGRVLRCNDAGARLLHFVEPLEYYAQPMQARSLRTIVLDAAGTPLPEDKWPFARILRGEVLSGSNTMDIYLGLHTGAMVVVSVSGAPVREADGNIIAAVCICREVTERRAKERQKQDTLDAIVALAGMLVQKGDATAPEVAHQVIELACDILGCTRAAVSVIEPESGRIIPFAVAGLSPEKEKKWWREQRSRSLTLSQVADQDFVAAMQAGTPKVYDFTKPPHKALPNPYDILSMVVAPLLVDGQMLGYLAFDHGEEYHQYSPHELQLAVAVAHLAGLIIDRERLMQEYMTSQAQAVALEESMSNMQSILGMTSHELRSPLTSIKANVQLAARAARKGIESDDRASEPVLSQLRRVVSLLESADRQTDQMNRFVTDLLDTTRIQAGKLEMTMSTEDVLGLVREVVRALRISWPDRRIELEAPECTLILSCDSGRISQVLTNLITNALKYSPGDLPVQVEATAAGDRVRIAVSDQGPGLSKEQREHIFDAFVQAEGIQQQGGTSMVSGGLGLGLFICRAIIGQHGGEIGVESDGTAGSTFWFTLPLPPAQQG
jgi:signal transduction histidine kinase/PAS domain-containing protein